MAQTASSTLGANVGSRPRQYGTARWKNEHPTTGSGRGGLPTDSVSHVRRARITTRRRVEIAERGWLYLLLLLEFQSTVYRRMASRMMDYTARVLQGLGRNDLGPSGEYPFVLPIVIYNGALATMVITFPNRRLRLDW